MARFAPSMPTGRSKAAACRKYSAYGIPGPVVDQARLMTTWLTRLISSRNSESEKNTPSTERHQTNDSPRRMVR